MSKGNTARFEASSRALTTFYAYVQYHLLAVRAKRDLLLVASTKARLAGRESKIRHAEEAYVAQTEKRDPAVAEGKIKRLRAKVYPGLVKVFDTILLSFEAMRDMEVVEVDDELAGLVEARIAYVRAVRYARPFSQLQSLSDARNPVLSCQYLSRGYALASQFASSLTLNARAKLYARQARSSAAAFSESFDLPTSAAESDSDQDYIADRLPLDSASFDSLDAELDSDHRAISQDWFAETGGRVGTSEEQLDFSRLSLSGDAAPPAATSASAKQKVPFFDVAYNYVTAFDMDAIAEKAGLRIPTAVPPTASAAAPASVAAPAVTVEETPAAEAPQQEQEATPTKRGWGFGLFGRR